MTAGSVSSYIPRATALLVRRSHLTNNAPQAAAPRRLSPCWRRPRQIDQALPCTRQGGGAAKCGHTRHHVGWAGAHRPAHEETSTAAMLWACRWWMCRQAVARQRIWLLPAWRPVAPQHSFQTLAAARPTLEAAASSVAHRRPHSWAAARQRRHKHQQLPRLRPLLQPLRTCPAHRGSGSPPRQSP